MEMKKRKRVEIWKLVILGFILGMPSLLMANSPVGGDPQTKESLFNTMHFQEMLPVILEMDIEQLLANRRTDEKVKAVLSFEDINGTLQHWNAKVKVRGKFRRTACKEMPPLKLDFSKKDLAAAGLAGFDDMKLVTHCVEDDRQAKQLLLKEYLAYKLYNQITEESFRVQFLKIIYVDSKTGSKKKSYGFLIEDTAELRARIDVDKWESPIGINPNEIDREQLKQVALFECMIGNVDWDFNKAHNVKVMEKNGKAIFIPYDFDFSGLVNAPYARLNTTIGQTALSDRIFLQDGVELSEIELMRSSFKDQKDKLLQTIKKLKYLDLQSKRESITFVKSFFRNSTPIKIPLQPVR